MTTEQNPIRRSLATLFQPDDTIELRCVGRRTINGLYRDQDKLTQDAHRLNTEFAPQENAFVCLNPVNPELFARRADEFGFANKGDCVKDQDVAFRRWLLVDCDASRPTGTSATDAEKQIACELAGEVYDYLQHELGGDCLIRADSGNGEHILIRLDDVAADDESRWVCDKFLKMLSEKFKSAGASVDTTTHNAARICTLYGTIKRKGGDTPERPHRQSKLLHVPSSLKPADWKKLTDLVMPYPGNKTLAQSTLQTNDEQKWDVDKLLADRSVVNTQDDDYQLADGSRATRWELEICPFNAEHNDRSAYLIQRDNGAVSFGCHHNGCSDHDWQALKTLWGLPASDGITAADIILPQSSSTSPPLLQQLGVLRLRPVSTANAAPVEWVWKGRIPKGKLTVVAGNGEIGKTTVACDLAAKLSTGAPLPDSDESLTGTTIFISDEEDEADIGKRVLAAGGDPDKILVLAEDEVFDNYGDDVPRLTAAIKQRKDVWLIVFDTLPDFLGQYNDHHNSGVRQSLRSLLRLARDTGVAILGLCHFNKSQQGAAGHRLLGSVAYRNLPRSVLYVLQDPDDEQRRIVYHEKSNLAPKAAPLALAIEGSENGAARVVWEEGICVIEDISRYLASGSKSSPNKQQIAMEWLQGPWGVGAGPKPATQVLSEAKNNGIARRTLYRAADELGISRNGEQWALPSLRVVPSPDCPA